MSSSFILLLLKKIYYFLLNNNLFLWCFSLWRKRKILSLAISLYHAGSSKVAYRFPKYIQVVLWNFEIRKNLYRNLSEIACLIHNCFGVWTNTVYDFAQGMGATTLVQKYSKASLAAIVSKEFAWILIDYQVYWSICCCRIPWFR